MTNRGVVVEEDMGADLSMAAVDIMAVMVVDAEDLAGAATTVAVDADIMVGAEATTRIRMEVINKVKVMDTNMMRKDITRNNNIIKLDHHSTSKGIPTTTWGQLGTVAILLQRHSVSTSVCALQEGIIAQGSSLKGQAFRHL